MKRINLWLMVTLFLSTASGLLAQDKYPSKTIQLILPYAAGGGVDAMARSFAREASKVTDSSWVVVNKDGAAGLVGFTVLANAPTDGYTLVFSPASPLVIAPFVAKSMPFKTDRITPICQVFENVFTIAVKPDSPIKSLAELIQRAKDNPSKLSYGHAGTGSVPHLSIGALEKNLGIKFNAIPYRGDGQMIPQLLAGDLDFGAPAVSSIAGKNMRVLAVLSDQRHPGVPDAPAITQLGFASVTPGLNGIYAPAGTPPGVLEYLQAICQKVVASEEFKKSSQSLQQVPAHLNAAQFKQRLDDVYRLNSELVPSMQLEKN
jgi:tripartite-type tricarboxylate transporter receptor subunit TctC